MEEVALNNVQLDHLANTQPALARVYYGAVPCDRLPKTLPQDEGPTAYIVNTDPHDEPGTHWIAVWTHRNVCEVMDSYAVSLDVYGTAEPLKEWMDRHFKYQIHNGKSFQSIFSQSCGDYALMFLIDRAEGRSMSEFLNRFESRRFVENDHKVGHMLTRWIENVTSSDWCKICKLPYHQDTSGSSKRGVHPLLQ